MTREEAIAYAKKELKAAYERAKKVGHKGKTRYIEVLEMSISALSQQPCDDAISREELLKAIETWDKFGCDADTKLVRYQDHYVPYIHYDDVIKCIKGMPSVTQKSGKCKNCKYFEYDSVAKVDGIPLIVAHEICNKWGDGCKTSEDGYCYLFEPQESEVRNEVN